MDAAQQLSAAHRALRADPTIQFSMAPAQPPPKPPAWLEDFLNWLENAMEPVGRFFRWIDGMLPDAPYARIFFWLILAAAAAALLWMIVDRVRHGEWRLPRFRRRRSVQAEVEEEEAWMPEQAPAREWLAEADALAAEGRFAEAAHHLLFRSVEDIARRRPQLVRPALTSRELAAAPVLPAKVRDLFGRIAALVERSLFGGRSVKEEEWAAARTAYSDFLLPGAWRA